ncbi:hypothetical protein COU56_02565 [Candidatus Pacearchaeota archaeon CG10_big_fil_rev_8_21_14_0_10_31_9]|nr:MAG: hypothetical protein COU56_02565 [Candidatus Pacearchaeota archaeon CG10_big_fil_rev_8_21_14_0_10_31_9]PIZ82666.1 MAG: hypothetical protein COX97_03595 [Candidatus Pacearchaeota archaeon CG_4_10_14_0_2_um_filter_05_32_18]
MNKEMNNKKHSFWLWVNLGFFSLFLIVFIVSVLVRLEKGLGFEFFNAIKPATIIQYSGFLSFAFFLQIIKPLFVKFPKQVLNILILFGFFAMMATLFEVFWAFHFWFSTYELNVVSGQIANTATLDTLTYTPIQELRAMMFYDSYSLNFSAKKNMLYFAIAVYFTYVMNSIWVRKTD